MENLHSMGDQFLAIVNRIIDENLANEHFSVEDLAGHAGLSRSMLHRKLIKLTGKSATDLITERRLMRAKDLLENDAATTSEIAYQVGFGSPSYFHRVFKKHFRVSPGDVRKGTSVHYDQHRNGKKQKLQAFSGLKTSALLTYALLLLFAIVFAISAIFILSKDKKPAEKVIAILPFDNYSPDEENQYFADGIVEDLHNRLSRLKDLKVKSRPSCEMFRDRGNKSIPEIARKLGAVYILIGSVQREADNIRITGQLIDAKSDYNILPIQYDRNISEVFKIQGEIAGQIANELSMYLSDDQLTEIQRNQTDNLEAYNHYLTGRIHQDRGGLEETLTSRDYYKKAIQADSNYALAYAALAGTYYTRTMNGHGWIQDLKSGKDSAANLVFKALEIDENLPEAHRVLGNIYRNLDYDYKSAEREFLKAIELGNTGHIPYAWLLCMTGRPEKARDHVNKALFLDPLTAGTRFSSAITYMITKSYDKALEEFKIGLEIDPDNWGALELSGLCNLMSGKEKAAYENLRKVGPLYTAYRQYPMGYKLDQADSAYRASGMEGFIRFYLRKMGAHHRKALFYLALGEYEKAIDMLEILYNNDDLAPGRLLYFYVEEMESNPRFQALKKKFKLDKY